MSIQLTPKELGYQDSILDYTDWQTGEIGVSSPIRDIILKLVTLVQNHSETYAYHVTLAQEFLNHR